MLLGFVIGLVAGYGRSYVFGPEDLDQTSRLVMAFQIGAAFAVLALFILNYLELRRRVIEKALAARDKDHSTS